MDFLEDFIQFFLRNPILILFLIGPIMSVVGKVLQGAARKAEQTRRRQAAAARETQMPSMRPAESTRAAVDQEQQSRMSQPRSQARPLRQPSARREPQQPQRQQAPKQVTPEPVAERIRALLEGRPPRPSATPAMPSQAVPVSVPVPRPPQPKSQSARVPSWNKPIGTVRARVEPTVGQAMEDRKGPMSGQVGKSSLGTLGGRTPRVKRRKNRAYRDLITTENMAAMVVAQEIMGLPVSIREGRY